MSERNGSSTLKWFMVVDVDLCQDCGNCYLACKDEYFGNTFPGYSLPQLRHDQHWIRHTRKERGHGSLMEVSYLPEICMHCDDAPCVKAGRDGAVIRRKDGIVLIDPVKAKGREDLVKACPYGAISWNPEQQVPQKCTLCAHLLDNGWKTTRCAQVCPTGALRLMRMTDGQRREMMAKGEFAPYRPELRTSPRTLYRNLMHFEKAFIAGSVAARNGEVVDCVAGAEITLQYGDSTIARCKTDNYGDFKFDGISIGSGPYTITIDAGGNGKKTMSIDVDESVYLNDIVL